jgi:hypothetical protein
MAIALVFSSQDSATLVYQDRALNSDKTAIVERPATRRYEGPAKADAVSAFASKVCGTALVASEVSPGVFALSAEKPAKGK